jgi:hypothetical protein
VFPVQNGGCEELGMMFCFAHGLKSKIGNCSCNRIPVGENTQQGRRFFNWLHGEDQQGRKKKTNKGEKQTVKRLEDISKLPDDNKNFVLNLIDMALRDFKVKKAHAS